MIHNEAPRNLRLEEHAMTVKLIAHTLIEDGKYLLIKRSKISEVSLMSIHLIGDIQVEVVEENKLPERLLCIEAVRRLIKSSD